MTSKSSKTLPYLATFILIAVLLIEVRYNIDIDLETALPFLMAIGVSGAGLKAVERAAKARQIMPEGLEKFIKMQNEQVEKMMTSFQNMMRDPKP